MPLFADPWPYLDPAEEFTRLADQRYALFFDSNCPGSPQNRYSYICWAPVEIIEAKNSQITVTNREQQLSFRGNPFNVLQERLEAYAIHKETKEGLPPFQGGAAGSFGYDLGRSLETFPNTAQDNASLPDMMIGIYDQVIAYDHDLEQAWIMIHAESEQEKDIKKRMIESLQPHQRSYQPFSAEWFSDVSEEQYKGDIQSIIDQIYAGEVFQVNISRRLEAKILHSFDSYGHYQFLRQTNAAPFSAYMNFGDIQIASSSPEQFLKIENGQIETRPIKGTLSDTEDKRLLQESKKDLAENLMIVDLMRNDLSRVCDPGSIQVPELFRLDHYEGLYHLTSIVTGQLQKNKTPVDALKACFPPGSVTGAPKIRAMEIIEELEPYRRGPYCGSLGMIGFHGYMQTSVTIRTLIYQGDTVYLQTGGGIVADSAPESEYVETLNKAEAILASFDTSQKYKTA